MSAFNLKWKNRILMIHIHLSSVAFSFAERMGSQVEVLQLFLHNTLHQKGRSHISLYAIVFSLCSCIR